MHHFVGKQVAQIKRQTHYSHKSRPSLRGTCTIMIGLPQNSDLQYLLLQWKPYIYIYHPRCQRIGYHVI